MKKVIKMQPKIGIIIFPPPRSEQKIFSVPSDYISGILDAGGIPIGIPVSQDVSRCASYIDMIDGLLVPGGEDVSPRLYGEDPIQQVNYSNYDKDIFEYQLIQLAVEKKIPIFGICRGHQIINTALGGTLIQDIPSQTDSKVCHVQANELRSELTHSVRCQKGSLLGELLGETIHVNSFHHQAVKDIAPGLRAAAWASDGIVEGMESEDGNIWTVQWHPENLYRRYPIFKKLFVHLVEKGEKNEGNKNIL
jgi:putative glutamine amidotransferase